jgi:hypothetical protein
MPYPKLSFMEAADSPRLDPNGTVLPVDWELGGILPPTIKPGWSPPMPPDEARDHLRGLTAKVKGPGRLLARWRHAAGGKIEVILLLFRRPMPKGTCEDAPEWYKPRPDVYDRLRGKPII